MTTMNRRRFLKIAGGTLGASVVTCGGIGYFSSRRPEIDLPESSYDTGDGSRVLVAYASKCGSTADVADVVAQAMPDAVVDVRQVDHVKDVGPYQAVIVGSAIRAGAWLPEAVDFVKKHRSTLGQVPTAYFTVCMTLHEDTEKNRAEADGYMDPVRDFVAPVASQAFAGRVDFDTLSLLEEAMLRVMGTPEGDYRDWDAIHAWAESLPDALLRA